MDMFGLFKPALPISNEDKDWVDGSFLRLARILGAERMLEAHVYLPTPEDFPDRYDGSEDAMGAMFNRVARGLKVDVSSVVVDVFNDTAEVTQSLVRFGSGVNDGA